MNLQLTDNIRDNFPFISVIQYGNKEYVCLLINQDTNVTSIYDYELLKTDNEKQQFLNLGETWWWESNRLLPINIFLHREMKQFQPYIISMNTKDVTLLFGTVVSLQQLTKRTKRKTIQLVKPKK